MPQPAAGARARSTNGRLRGAAGALLLGISGAAVGAQGAEGPGRAAGAAPAAAALSPERRAALTAELTACLASEGAALAAEADAAWAQLGPRVAGGGAVERAAARGFVAQLVSVHGAKKARCANEAGWRVAPVAAAGLEAARAWLAAPGPALGPGDAGARWVGPSGYPMRLVPPGAYTIGCTPGQGSACGGDERPTRAVALHVGVFVGEVEVTQGLYRQVMGTDPSFHTACGEGCPVDRISWYDGLLLANALSRAEGLEECYRITPAGAQWPKGIGCGGYRLPTEAEWEIAARGGQDTLFAGGASPEAVAWTLSDSGGGPHPVGQKGANGYGLFDMSGNVLEWVWDGYAAAAYAEGPATDPLGPPGNLGRRVMRGGSWRLEPDAARLANRNEGPAAGLSPHLGVRLVRTAG